MSEQTTHPTAPEAPGQQHPEHHFQHDPDKTELEKWLNAGLKKVEPYTNQIVMAAIGIVVVIVAVVVWSNSTSSSQTAEWEEFIENRVPEDYMTLANESPNSQVGAWALLQAGRGFLQEGMRNALTNREVSDARLKDAVDAFEKLLKRNNAPDKAKEEALFGLGTAREVLANGDPASAIEAYQKLIEDFPESRHVAWATQRVEELQEQQTQEFYAWFRKQNPKPSDRPLPSDLLPKDDQPAELGNLDLLDEPSMKLPPTGVGEENKNTVPEEPITPDSSSEQPADAPKKFPTDGEKKPADEAAKEEAAPKAESSPEPKPEPPADAPASKEPAADESAAKPEAETPAAEEKSASAAAEETSESE